MTKTRLNPNTSGNTDLDVLLLEITHLKEIVRNLSEVQQRQSIELESLKKELLQLFQDFQNLKKPSKNNSLDYYKFVFDLVRIALQINEYNGS